MDQKRIREQVIKEYLSSEVSLRSLATKYNYNHNLIYRWVMEHQRLKRAGKLLSAVAELKDLPEPEPMSIDVGSLQEELRLSKIRILLLEATIDISDEQFGTNMRKKVGIRQS
jgi:transposase-like protein